MHKSVSNSDWLNAFHIWEVEDDKIIRTLVIPKDSVIPKDLIVPVEIKRPLCPNTFVEPDVPDRRKPADDRQEM